MFDRPSPRESYQQLVHATRRAAVQFTCDPPTQRTMRDAKTYIHRYATQMGVRIRVLTVDEYGMPLPPGTLCVIRPGWTPDTDEEDASA